ncbi:MAG TPA: endonuclease/exonuclease/phosphatase family protein [Chitinophagales bacterium]|jgi:endonuclease/exonuclease/phosphatase family metal-dependent hydrolase|nr:endonuclease/exonuclease/phosphatase family protein [Chitinophagales bacterium]
MKYLKWLLSFTSRTVNIVFVVLLLISLSASYISPEKIWLLPFAGLLLPFLVVVNIFFVIIWIARKRHFAMVSLLSIAACLPQVLKLAATNFTTPTFSKTDKTIKVLSYNVRDFDLYNWSDNVNSKHKIFETIRKQNADVISFQEFYNDTTKSFSTIKQLEALGYKYHFFTKELVLRNTDEWGIALFSKYPIKESGKIIQQNFKTGYGKKPFKGLYADIVIADTVIRFVNVHLQSIYFGTQDYQTIEEFRVTQNLDEHGAKNIIVKLKKAFERRAQQADELKTFLNAQTKPIILCGDFNDLPNSYTINTVAKNMKDAFLSSGIGIGKTYNGKLPLLRIDYIFTSKDFKIQKFNVLDNNISDHFPIYMECVLNKP